MRTRDPVEVEPVPVATRYSRLTSLDSVWVAIAIALPSIVAMKSAIVMIDLAYHLRAGEYFLHTGSIQRTNLFSFVEPGREWLNQQWGAQVVLATLDRAGGFATLSFGRVVAMAAIALFLFLSCRARGADRRTSSVLTSLGTLLALPTLGIRPQLFGLLLFAACLWILTTRSSHPSRLWALPFLATLWANLHGSFLFLLPLLVLALTESWIRRESGRTRLMTVAVLSLVGTLVNPFGPSVWTYVIDITANPIVRDWVTEWAPLSIRDPFGVLLFASIGAVVFVLVRKASDVTSIDLLWLGIFAVVGLTAVRSLAWWAFVAPVVVAGLLRPSHRPASRGVPLVNACILFAAAAIGVLLLPWWRPIPLGAAPERLVATVAKVTDPGARVIVEQTYASWFELALPDRKVFVDSRIELYDRSVWTDYQSIRNARADWSEIVDRWDANTIVAEPSWALVRFIKQDPGWRLIFEDDDGLVFVRT